MTCTALALRAGGVDYYANSGFIHVDTGRVRAWERADARTIRVAGPAKISATR